MAKDNKTLLDRLLESETGANEEVLEDLLGMNEGIKTDDLAFLVQQAENGNQDAVYAVGISYMYAENGFPQDELEGVFWLSQSTNEDAPRHVAGYYLRQGDLENMKEWALKANELGSLNAFDLYHDLFKQYWKGENQDLECAEQCLEVLLELDVEDDRKTSVYRLAVGLASEYLNEDDYKKGLEWAKVACGHIDPALEAQMIGGIYAMILFDAEDCDEYIPEALEYITKQAEQNSDADAIENLALYYMKYSDDTTKAIFWAEKAAENGFADAQYWLAETNFRKADLDKADKYLKLLEMNTKAEAEVLRNASALRKKIDSEIDKKYNVPKKILKSDDAEKLLKEIESTKGTVLRIPHGFTEIDTYAFSNCAYIKSITEIILPETIQTIGKLAFWGCCNLTKINLPKRLKSIGKHALCGATTKGIFLKTVKSSNVIEELIIPAQTQLVPESLGDISGIGRLSFEEGRTELEWSVFHGIYQETRIGELRLPASMQRLTRTGVLTEGI